MQRPSRYSIAAGTTPDPSTASIAAQPSRTDPYAAATGKRLRRRGHQPQPRGRDDPQRPLAADQQRPQVEPRDVLAHRPAEGHQLARRDHRLDAGHPAPRHAVLEGVRPARVGREVAARAATARPRPGPAGRAARSRGRGGRPSRSSPRPRPPCATAAGRTSARDQADPARSRPCRQTPPPARSRRCSRCVRRRGSSRRRGRSTTRRPRRPPPRSPARPATGTRPDRPLASASATSRATCAAPTSEARSACTAPPYPRRAHARGRHHPLRRQPHPAGAGGPRSRRDRHAARALRQGPLARAPRKAARSSRSPPTASTCSCASPAT